MAETEEFATMESAEDRNSTQDSNVIPNDSENEEENKEKIRTKETVTAPGVVNWRALAAEFTREKLWMSRDWKSIGKHLLISFCFGFFFSALDVFTDGWSGFTFIFGTDYIKNVASPNDTSVADTDSCKNVG